MFSHKTRVSIFPKRITALTLITKKMFSQTTIMRAQFTSACLSPCTISANFSRADPGANRRTNGLLQKQHSLNFALSLFILFFLFLFPFLRSLQILPILQVLQTSQVQQPKTLINKPPMEAKLKILIYFGRKKQNQEGGPTHLPKLISRIVMWSVPVVQKTITFKRRRRDSSGDANLAADALTQTLSEA